MQQHLSHLHRLHTCELLHKSAILVYTQRGKGLDSLVDGKAVVLLGEVDLCKPHLLEHFGQGFKLLANQLAGATPGSAEGLQGGKESGSLWPVLLGAAKVHFVPWSTERKTDGLRNGAYEKRMKTEVCGRTGCMKAFRRGS